MKACHSPNILWWLCLICAASPSIANAADANLAFKPGPASSFANRQGQAGVILAGEAYSTAEKVKPPFGKLNPNEHGVLPVLLLVENTSQQVIRLEQIRVQYIDATGRKIDHVPAKDVPYLRGPSRPKIGTNPFPGIGGKKKNPLAAMEIESRAFAAKMVPPGDAAHGFFYFQVEHRPGAILYVTGLQEASTGKDLFFFEIPLP
jgi:hypothetical protein